MTEKLSLKEISKTMRDIDICMMTTKNGAALESRPMSNNRQVDYDGDSYFFAYGDSSAVQQINADTSVSLSFVSHPAVIGKPFYLAVEGKAEIISERAEMEKHWVKDVEVWFKDGLDTPGIRMIHVKASKLKYWHNYKEGELILNNY